jgi:ATP adenylyltransferase
LTRKPGCPFCDIVAGDASARVLSRGRGVTVFLPDQPATLGHTLVVPDDHVEDVWGLDQGAARNVASEVLRVSHAVRDALQPDGLNIIQSNGPGAGQTVPHLHVHVLPRWTGDTVGDIWPESPQWSASELSRTQTLLTQSLESAVAPGYDLSSDQDREDRRKHLDLVSAAIGRMAGSSAATKGWAVTLAGAAFGVALVRESWPLIVLGILVVLALGAVDARYLENERRARGVYAAIADDNAVAPLSMKGIATSSAKVRWWWPARFQSWSIWYFYAPLLLAGAILLVFALSGFSDVSNPELPQQEHGHDSTR